MNSGFLISALFMISALTSLTVESLKKIVKETGKECNATLLAAIVSIILTVCICVGYVLYIGVPFTMKELVITIAMTFLSFLSSTVGFDKVKEVISK